MPVQDWLEKACNMLSSVWRTQGAPESDEVATEDFLKRLSQEFAGKTDQNPEWTGSLAPPVGVVNVDEEGFDCRVGERARKRRREARKTATVKQKPSDAKGDRRKRAKVAEEKATAAKKRASSAPKNRPKPAEKATPANLLPPGWQIVREGKVDTHSSQETFLSWDRVSFESFAQVQKYCSERSIQMPRKSNAGRPSDTEVDVMTLKLLQGWLAQAGRVGATPPGRGFQIAAIKARQKRHLSPSTVQQAQCSTGGSIA